jgi:hypothetical protein
MTGAWAESDVGSIDATSSVVPRVNRMDLLFLLPEALTVALTPPERTVAPDTGVPVPSSRTTPDRLAVAGGSSRRRRRRRNPSQ